MKIGITDSFLESLDKLFSPWGRLKSWWWNNSPFKNARRIWQRGTRGWADEDLWNLKNYLGKVIYQSIRAYRDVEKSGYPCSFDNDKDWDAALTVMADGFYELTEWDDVFDEVIKKHKATATGPERFFMGHSMGPDWGNDAEKQAYFDEHDARYQEAMRKAKTFVDHFAGMWD